MRSPVIEISYSRGRIASRLVMQISMPFLATALEQLPQRSGAFEAVEAVVFDRSALDIENWQTVWRLIQQATKLYAPSQVTFHFPVNDSDYVFDNFVRDRLAEALSRSLDAALHGVVVHSNRIRPIEVWNNLSIMDERRRVIDCLASLVDRYSPARLLLENMPIMDNLGVEIDPLFVFPNDFTEAIDAGLGIVWDICHYSNTVAAAREVCAGRQKRRHYPNLQQCDYLDFLEIGRHIHHWHFSAFSGIANPDTGQRCIEGVHPIDSTLGQEIYLRMLRAAFGLMRQDTHVVLEIQEDSYVRRSNFFRVCDWLNKARETSAEETSET